MSSLSVYALALAGRQGLPGRDGHGIDLKGVGWLRRNLASRMLVIADSRK